MITEADYAEVPLTDAEIMEAKSEVEWAYSSGEKQSWNFGYNDKRTFIGFLGEQAVLKHLAIDYTPVSYEYDMMFRGWKLEVKTVACKFIPPAAQRNFYAIANSSAPDRMTAPVADFYVFVRLHKNPQATGGFDMAWIVGCMSVGEFLRKGKFCPLGYKEPGIHVRTSPMTVLPIQDLHPIKLLETIKEKDT